MHAVAQVRLIFEAAKLDTDAESKAVAQRVVHVRAGERQRQCGFEGQAVTVAPRAAALIMREGKRIDRPAVILVKNEVLRESQRAAGHAFISRRPPGRDIERYTIPKERVPAH